MPEDFFATAAQAHPMPKQDRENTVKDMNEEPSESTQSRPRRQRNYSLAATQEALR